MLPPASFLACPCERGLFDFLGSRPVVGHDVAGAEVAAAGLAGFRSVRTQAAHERQYLVPLLRRQRPVLIPTVEVPSAREVIQVTDAATIDEQRVERVVREVVEPEHMPYAADPGGPGECVRSDVSPSHRSPQGRMPLEEWRGSLIDWPIQNVLPTGARLAVA